MRDERYSPLAALKDALSALPLIPKFISRVKPGMFLPYEADCEECGRLCGYQEAIFVDHLETVAHCPDCFARYMGVQK